MTEEAGNPGDFYASDFFASLALPLRTLRSKAFNRRVRRDGAENAKKPLN